MERRRYQVLDTIRGCALVSMILYHACWDLVYLFGIDWPWYHGFAAHVWQQSICWTFILLSGYCFALGRHQLRRGLTVFFCGALITAATWFFMPENLVLFGVLTCWDLPCCWQTASGAFSGGFRPGRGWRGASFCFWCSGT